MEILILWNYCHNLILLWTLTDIRAIYGQDQKLIKWSRMRLDSFFYWQITKMWIGFHLRRVYFAEESVRLWYKQRKSSRRTLFGLCWTIRCTEWSHCIKPNIHSLGQYLQNGGIISCGFNAFIWKPSRPYWKQCFNRFLFAQMKFSAHCKTGACKFIWDGRR